MSCSEVMHDSDPNLRKGKPFPLRILLVAMSLFVVSICAYGQSLEELQRYSIPSEIYQIGGWTGLTSADTHALKQLMASDIASLSKGCDEKLSFEDIDASSIDLGKLGKGLVVRVNHPCLCSNGNCPVFVVINEKGHYRVALRGADGWGFAVFREKVEIPDVVLARHQSAAETALVRYHYIRDKFVMQTCETAVREDAGDGSWNPKAMAVRPCTNTQ